jgi:hypothetical protein
VLLQTKYFKTSEINEGQSYFFGSFSWFGGGGRHIRTFKALNISIYVKMYLAHFKNSYKFL